MTSGAQGIVFVITANNLREGGGSAIRGTPT